MNRNILHTDFCDMYGIKYPIVLAGMGYVSGPALTAAVSNAGGLGVLGAASMTTDELPEMIERTISIFENLKMRNVFMDSPVQHDKHIAYVSHLSHISSFMLGKTVLEIEKDEKSIFNMAGSGFASTVRLAKSNPETWTPIFLQNRDNLLKSLEEYIKNLNQFKDILTRKSADDVLSIMEDTNRIKDVLAGIKHE